MCHQDRGQEHHQDELKCWNCKSSHQPGYPVIGRSCFCYEFLVSVRLSSVLYPVSCFNPSEPLQGFQRKQRSGNFNLEKFAMNPNPVFLCVPADWNQLMPVAVPMVLMLMISLKLTSMDCELGKVYGSSSEGRSVGICSEIC